MSLLKREANEIPLIRRLNDHYRLFPCEYPDLCAVCALDPSLVRGSHSPGTSPEPPKDSGTHQRAGALCPSPLRTLRGDRFCRGAVRLCRQFRTDAWRAFYEQIHPWASTFMALFGRDRLPARSTLSRFLAALDQTPVEALRSLFLKDLLARPLVKEEQSGGLWDRQGNHFF